MDFTGNINARPARLRTVMAGLVALSARALDSVLPPQCLACSAAIEGVGAVSASCWTAIDRVGVPMYDGCGVAFEFDHGAEALCGACVAQHPPFARARAVMAYDDIARDLIVGFKHGDKTYGAPAFGAWQPGVSINPRYWHMRWAARWMAPGPASSPTCWCATAPCPARPGCRRRRGRAMSRALLASIAAMVVTRPARISSLSMMSTPPVRHWAPARAAAAWLILVSALPTWPLVKPAMRT